MSAGRRHPLVLGVGRRLRLGASRPEGGAKVLVGPHGIYEGSVAASPAKGPARWLVGTPGREDVAPFIDERGRLGFVDHEGHRVSGGAVRRLRDRHPQWFSLCLEDCCEDLNDALDAIVDVHLGAPPPGTELDFVMQPFVESPPEEPVVASRGILATLFGAADSNESWERARLAYEGQRLAWMHRREVFEAEQIELRRQFYEERASMLPVMERFLGRHLEQVDWPVEQAGAFVVRDRGRTVCVDVHVGRVERFPGDRYHPSADGEGVDVIQMSAPEVNLSYAHHVCGAALRLGAEVFVMLPSAREVVTAVWAVEGCCVCSARLGRRGWESVFGQGQSLLDPVGALEPFEHVIAMGADSLLLPVEPLGR